MIRVQAGITRKRGLPRYSSAQASCSIDAEVDGALREDGEKLAAVIRGLYRTCELAVEEELDRLEEQARRAEDPLERPASAAQWRVIGSLVRRKRVDLAQLLASRFNRVDESGLTCGEASAVIDLLGGAASRALSGPAPDRSGRVAAVEPPDDAGSRHGEPDAGAAPRGRGDVHATAASR